MLNEKQIRGIKNIRTAIKYHREAMNLINTLTESYQDDGTVAGKEFREHQIMHDRLLWCLRQCFTQKELDSVPQD